MQRWFKLASFFLLAAWLPATLHCNLEAAGLNADSHSAGCCTENQTHGCEADLCVTVESSLIKESAPALQLAAPGAAASVHFFAELWAALADREPALAPTILSHAPPVLTARWHFLTRAAPPSRAPASLLA